MLYILAVWFLTAMMSFLAGHAVSWLLSRTLKINLITSFPILVLLGFAVLSAVLSWISIFTHINSLVFLSATLSLGAWQLYKRKGIRLLLRSYAKNIIDMPRTIPLLFVFGLITALIYCAVPTKCYDEGLYYTQTIKWISHYAAVPGLGNLESRLAMNSSWHLVAALFSFPSVKGAQMDDINGLLFVIIIMYSLGGIYKLLNKEFTLSNLLRAFLILPNFLFYFSIMGPAPDLVVTYYSLIIFILFLEKIKQKTIQVFDENFILILVFSIFLFTVKLSALTVLPVLLYLAILQLKRMQWKSILVMLIFALFTITPWMTRNVILSGYPLFPIPALNIIQTDWKMSSESVQGVTCAAEGWAKMPMKDCNEVHKMKLSQWMPGWFASKKPYDKAIFAVLILWLVIMPVYGIFRITKSGAGFFTENTGYLVLYFTFLCGIAVWFFKAPDFRFGYSSILGLIICSMGIVLAPILKKVSYKQINYIFSLGGFGSFAVMIFMLTVLEKSPKIFNDYIVSPAPLPVSKLELRTQNNVHYNLSTDAPQCWDAPLPAAPAPVSPALHLRTGNIKDGFSVK